MKDACNSPEEADPGAGPAFAARAGLVYYPDSLPGISRRRCGRGFSYIDADGARISDREERARIAALAVPPAWEEVWICPSPDGHLQATGLDQRGRKQYRYHPDWTEFRAQRKYDQLPDFAHRLPRIRRRLARDLTLDPGEQSVALAALVSLIDRLGLRVGNRSYLDENGSYGATTLRHRHLKLGPDGITLAFRAKGGQKVERVLKSPKLQRVLSEIDDLPGADLFTWLDAEGEPHPLRSEQVNAYLGQISGDDSVTAKTFRTWIGTLEAYRAALHAGDRLTIKEMTAAAAKSLCNTPTIARNSYIHPKVIALTELEPAERLQRIEQARECRISGLTVEEGMLCGFLES